MAKAEKKIARVGRKFAGESTYIRARLDDATFVADWGRAQEPPLQTPDALEKILEIVRPYLAKRKKRG